ncbi:MAG TPA: amidohydrolase family protein [Planctomycetota bacterium]|nr:amidohydrolase family protein [Planctomycetota bacterium]
MRVIDFHLHLFSRTYFETLAALSPLPGSVEERLAELERRVGIEIPARELESHVQRWLASMDAHGVEQAAAFASVAEEIPVLARVRELSGGRMTPFALVNPRAPGCPEKVDGLLGPKGFAGVLLFPAMHHYELDSAECEALFEVLDRHRALAFVHCGELVVKLRDLLGIARTADAKFADPLRLVALANRFPNARFVIPHFGGGRFQETLEAGAQCSNILVDTSSSNSWMTAQGLSLKNVFARALEVFGATRIVFGTDSTTFPKGWQRARFDDQQRALVEIGLSEEDLNAIFCENARELLVRVV